jgi:3'-phosphoadenosine 5'-phosphosulfate sulfotransferase (PAPS reductase)/FAD synthetase
VRPFIDITKFDIILINTSGGKDSLAMMSYITKLALTLGVFCRVTAVHADLGRCEWQGTRELVKRQCDHFGVHIDIVSKPVDILEQVEKRGMWPDKQNRYCTSDQKRDPIATVMTRLVKEYKAAHPGHGRVRILNCMGIRKEESPDREKMTAFELNKRQTNKTRREVWNWLPIHEWTVAMVWWEIGMSRGEHHYAYDLGMPRLSCVFCIFAPRAALVLAGRHNRKLLDAYVETERKIGHTFRHKFAIADVATELENETDTEREQCPQENKKGVRCTKGIQHQGPCRFRPMTLTVRQAELMRELDGRSCIEITSSARPKIFKMARSLEKKALVLRQPYYGRFWHIWLTPYGRKVVRRITGVSYGSEVPSKT